jgi:hypothetical protein
MVCKLSGHVFRQLEVDDHQTKHTRLLFWICYMQDKDIALRSGIPPLLSENYCDIITPKDGLLYNPLCPKGGWEYSLFMDPDLGSLKERIFHQLFSPHTYAIPDSHLLLRIRRLDSDLENWRLSIPIHIRPRLSIVGKYIFPEKECELSRSIRHIYLQLEYHYLLTIVHTTVRRCRGDGTEASDIPEDLHTVIHSSIDLSLEASRSTLSFIGNFISILPNETF